MRGVGPAVGDHQRPQGLAATGDATHQTHVAQFGRQGVGRAREQRQRILGGGKEIGRGAHGADGGRGLFAARPRR
jgi:hypothetical protein